MQCVGPKCEKEERSKSLHLCSGHWEQHRLGKPLRPLRNVRRRGPVCTRPGCDRPHVAKGFCGGHYARWKRGADLDAPMRTPWRGQIGACLQDGCDRPKHSRGYCKTHHARLWRGTTAMDAPLREAGAWSAWYIKLPSGYVERTRVIDGKKERQLQHRVVWEEAHGPLLPRQNIHHKNGVRHDNRLENLEMWDTSQPSGQRVEDKLAHAREMFERYAEVGETWIQDKSREIRAVEGNTQ